MKKFTTFAALALVMVFALSSFAGVNDIHKERSGYVPYEGATNLAKAEVDTILLMGPEGSGAQYIGDFESGWNGFFGLDATRDPDSFWSISDYQQTGGNHVAWCGDISLASCGEGDPDGGYASGWNQLLIWRATVADPNESASVVMEGELYADSEPDWDFTFVGFWKNGFNAPTYDLPGYDGPAQTNQVTHSTTYLPGEYMGGTDVMVVVGFESDGNTDDSDCSYPSDGGCRLDDITVTVTQAGQATISDTDDFEDGRTLFDDTGDVEPPQQEWYQGHALGVGEFAWLWTGLTDIDPCGENPSQQVAFIDDGRLEGLDGSNCITWCYGPGGYIVNPTGGLIGPTAHLENYVVSPVMTWPNAAYDGIFMEYDVFGHEDGSVNSSGIYYTWDMKSADTDAGQTMATQPWSSNNTVYFGNASYVRPIVNGIPYTEPDRDLLQVRFGAYELGWFFGGGTSQNGEDGYPAPYFDNIAIRIYPYSGGPSMLFEGNWDRPSDTFLSVDAIDFNDLAGMSARFDMNQNISLVADMRNDPGDSIVVQIQPIRAGAELRGRPEMHYALHENPVFDPFRTMPATGFVLGQDVTNAAGTIIPDEFSFDLPDTGFLYPGDILHVYILGRERVTDGTIYEGTYPRDISHFGDFSDPLAYFSLWTINVLPTINETINGYEIPKILFWNDYENRGVEEEWFNALRNNGLKQGEDYDTYYTGAPTSSVGSGIGGRTSGLAMEYYEDLLYCGGQAFSTTLSNGDFGTDGGDDIGALLLWMSAGNKDLFLTGDGIAEDLSSNAGTAGSNWFEQVMGLSFTGGDLREFINNQTAPQVFVTDPGTNPVFDNPNLTSWIAYGGCPGINLFDAVEALPGAMRLAEFGDPNNNPGAYSFAAATLNTFGNNNRIVSMPYDFSFINTIPVAKDAAPLPARSLVMADILEFFGIEPGTEVVGVGDTPRQTFAVSNYPNPFNPRTKISYQIKAPGHLTLKIFNVRGELVKTLIDGHVDASDFVMWDGTNDGGNAVASGVYFYEGRMGTDVQTSKLTLLK